MFDDDFFEDDNSRVDADTNLADIDWLRIANIKVDVNTANIDTGVDDEPSVFAANNLLKKTADNLSRAEAMVDDQVLPTEKTAELEKQENEENPT